MPAAKTLAGALTAIVVYLVAQVGLDLPEVVVAALEVVLTGAVVYLVPNKSQPEPAQPAGTLYTPPTSASGGTFALAPLFLVNEVSGNDVERWIGFALVVGFLIAAGVALFRYSNYLVAGGLAILALISGVLLL